MSKTAKFSFHNIHYSTRPRTNISQFLMALKMSKMFENDELSLEFDDDFESVGGGGRGVSCDSSISGSVILLILIFSFQIKLVKVTFSSTQAKVGKFGKIESTVLRMQWASISETRFCQCL